MAGVPQPPIAQPTNGVPLVLVTGRTGTAACIAAGVPRLRPRGSGTEPTAGAEFPQMELGCLPRQEPR